MPHIRAPRLGLDETGQLAVPRTWFHSAMRDDDPAYLCDAYRTETVRFCRDERCGGQGPFSVAAASTTTVD